MSAIPPLGVNNNQIQIQVEDSCNCCCFRFRRKKIPDDTLVFVNQHGVAINFNHREWSNRIEAMTTALSNIHLKLAQIAEQNAIDKAEIEKALADKDIAPKLGTPVTLRLVRGINNVLHDMLGAEESGSQ